MVKNLPTVERSTKIRFGKNCLEDQAENTIVFNASDQAINASSEGSVYMTPLRQRTDLGDRSITILAYNQTTKEVMDSGAVAEDILDFDLEAAVKNGNVTSNTVSFNNTLVGFTTLSNVGIANGTPSHTLDVGSNLYVDDTGSNVLVVTGNVRATGSYYGDGSKLTGLVTTFQDVSDNGNTTSNVVQFTNPTTGLVVSSNVGVSNTNPLHNLSVGSNLYVDDVGSNVLVVTGNVQATGSYYGDGSKLTGLVTTLQDVSDNGNTTSNVVQFTNPTTGFVVDSNIVVGGNVTGTTFLGDGGLLSNIAATLNDIVDQGNTTSNVVQFTNPTTGLVVDSNIVVGGNVTATTFLGDGGLLSNLVTTLQDVSDNGNTTSNTLQFTNAHTAFTTDLTSNVGVNLNQLANVTLTTPQNEDILVYDGSNWTNQLQNHTFLQGKALETISKGDVVYAAGHTGNEIFNIRKARADSSTTMPALGVAYQSLAVNGVGLVVTFGRADGLNTDGFISGETVYVSNVVAGGISNVVPQAETDLIQNVGLIVKPHISTGIIDVTGVGRVNAIPNAQVVTTQPPHIYTNGGGNTFEKMDPADVLTKLQTLQQVTDTGNTTSNTIQFTNATTGLVTTANLEVGSNISVSGLADSVNKYLPMVDNDGTFIQSPVYVTSGGTYVISASEAEFLGNITLGGNNTVVSSTSVTIEDRIFGIGANNAVHNLDTGIIMEHKDDEEYANVALIYHADEHRFSMSYTQNTFTDNHILHYEDPDHRMLIDLRGNLVVQNNATFNETLDVLGEFTTSSNVGIANVSTNHTLNVGSNLYVDDVGSNVLVVSGNVLADSYYGDGSKLTGLVTTLQDVSDNGNTTSNVIQFTNADTAFTAIGGIITNTGGVTKKTYSFAGDMGSGATPAAATIGIVFSQHVFYAKIVAHLIQADNEVSTISIEASGGHRTGGTPLNVAKGPASVFGNTNTNPWSSVVTTDPTTLFIKPSGTLSQLGNYNVFIEFISEHSDGKVVKITEGGVDEVTFAY
jgi:hypothetical protein